MRFMYELQYSIIDLPETKWIVLRELILGAYLLVRGALIRDHSGWFWAVRCISHLFLLETRTFVLQKLVFLVSEKKRRTKGYKNIEIKTNR